MGFKRSDIELMAPVGSFEALHAAIQAGANAVYFGVGKLNMRSGSSKNFQLQDLGQIAKICAEHNVSSYLTVNTVMFDGDLEDMQDLVLAAKKSGITAIIAADPAVLQFAKEIGQLAHISTQANISNYPSVEFYAQFADVMVLARELSLEQTRHITNLIEERHLKGPNGNPVRLEIFAHGALCMAVSGKCYLSLHQQNVSANQGQCRQECRKKYVVTEKDSGKELEIDNEYIMSAKDLNTLPFLDKVVNSGARVLKLEGRGRSPEYVKVVTETYHKALIAIEDGTFNDEKILHFQERLESVFNRGFWDGYYLSQTMGEWNDRHGSKATKRKVYVGKVTNYFNNLQVAEIKMETHDLALGEDMIIMGPTTGVIECVAKEFRMDDQQVSKVSKGDVFSIPAPEKLRRSDKIYKVIDA